MICLLSINGCLARQEARPILIDRNFWYVDKKDETMLRVFSTGSL